MTERRERESQRVRLTIFVIPIQETFMLATDVHSLEFFPHDVKLFSKPF